MTLEEFANETFGDTLTEVERLFVRTLARDLHNNGYRVVKLEIEDTDAGSELLTYYITEELS